MSRRAVACCPRYNQYKPKRRKDRRIPLIGAPLSFSSYMKKSISFLHRSLDVSVGIALRDSLPLVVILLTLAKAECHFNS